MKIIHFCESINIGGGIASLVSALTSEQSSSNNVTIGVIGKSTGEEVEFESNIKIFRLNKCNPGFSVKYPFLIFMYLLKNKFDIVHIHSAFLYYVLSIIFLHRKMKFVYTVHSDAKMENSSTWDKRFFWLKKFCFKRKYIYPITISPLSKKSFDDLYGMESHMIENGIKKPNVIEKSNKLDKYRFTNNTKIFLHPGRISKAKNQIILCEAFQRVIHEGNDVVLLIAGVNQDKSIFDQISKYFSDRIIYLGERRDILDLLSESDAMCLSSIWEGLPITLLEAMSVGCVPICTPVGGIPNVIYHKKNGIISESTSAEDYYKSIMEYLKMSISERDIMSLNAIVKFNDYDIKYTSMKYLAYYSLIIN